MVFPIAARPLTRRRSPWRYLLWAIPAIVELFLARTVVNGGSVTAAEVALLVASPVLAYVTYRWPGIFPFGVYVATVPIDALVSINGGLTLTRLIGVFAGACLILRMIVVRRAVRPSRAWSAWGVMLLWMAATTIWSVDQTNSVASLQVMISLYLIYSIVSIYPIKRVELFGLLVTMIVTGVGIAIYAYVQYQSGAMYSDSRLQLGNDQYSVDPNHFAATFMLPISLAATGFIALRPWWIRLALAGATGLMGLGLVLTGSRGGLISFGVMIVYIGIRSRRLRQTGAIAAVALAASAAFPKVYERFNDPSQGAASGRFYIWEVVKPALTNQMRWIYGNGLFSFPAVYDRSLRDVFQHAFQGYDRVGHNIIVQSSVEFGVIGMALLGFAWYQSWKATDVIVAGSPWFALRVANEATVIAMLITAFSIDLLWFKYFWLALMLGPLVRNAYAPEPLFSRRAPAPVARAARIVTSRSSAVADFEHTSVAPEM